MNPNKKYDGRRMREHATPTPPSVIHDVRNLLFAVEANVTWLRAAAEKGTDPRELLDALVDLEGCAARMRKILST